MLFQMFHLPSRTISIQVFGRQMSIFPCSWIRFKARACFEITRQENELPCLGDTAPGRCDVLNTRVARPFGLLYMISGTIGYLPQQTPRKSFKCPKSVRHLNRLEYVVRLSGEGVKVWLDPCPKLDARRFI